MSGSDPEVAHRDAPACLNCGEALHGRFCSRCGQRSVPPYPSIREMAGDAWQELSGYDGRFVRTLRRLFAEPGALTLDVLEGRRARFISPVRLYLVASVVYFLIAAAAPNVRARPAPAPVVPGSTVTIDLSDPAVSAMQMTPEEREEVVRALARAPWWVRPLLEAVLLQPAEFRRRFLTNLPRVLFALVPVFAGIVSVFYRRRPFSQHLVLALHVHTVAFLAMAAREGVSFSGSGVAAIVAQAAALLFILAYGLRAFRRVYRERWTSVALKAAGIVAIYLVVGLTALLATVAWTALT